MSQLTNIKEPTFIPTIHSDIGNALSRNWFTTSVFYLSIQCLLCIRDHEISVFGSCFRGFNNYDTTTIVI